MGYANDRFAIYFLCGKDSQKATNLTRDNRVSLAIDDDTPQVMEITGLSIAARAEVMDDLAEGKKALRLLFERYPEQNSMLGPLPTPSDVRIFG
ncbi:pyridoxamine 5'-phosphate oxidase family protein [Bradyrhizobium sp. USDA 3458]|uniref:pyridoxamine 5'-phosphate oxidase family protein n=1 Tax=Bradyrhizobium sp. USDA 3458 TaxID=2591461 RepID=UPI001FEFC1B4|nr:pyridoxamine 5'-phosphate oxidase family protein [Bradyrhizobium sp. USDA 3458]